MDNMMPGTFGYNDPANVPDWMEEEADICDDCNKLCDYCECENPSGFHREWVYKCPDCKLLFRDDSELDHGCEGYQSDDY